jgi:dolichol-phosphate mannosyltransferase
MHLSIVVPCYNEADNVGKVEGELLPVADGLAGDASVEVIFVDDGSRDQTWERLHEMADRRGSRPAVIRFERHAANRGLGAAIRTGLNASRGDVVVTTDSDGTYRFAEIPELLACLKPDVDIVTASPYHPQGGVAGVPGYRLLLSRGSSAIYRLLVSPRIHTYTALFRAYRRPVVEQVSFSADGFLAGTELLVKAMLKGFRVAEYPSVLRSRVYGVSKARLARTIRSHLGFQWQILLYRMGLRRRAVPAAGRNA